MDEQTRSRAFELVEKLWRVEAYEAICDHIAIPAMSAAFSSSWATDGYLDEAVERAVEFGKALGIEGLVLDVLRIEGLSPTLVFEIPASMNCRSDQTVLVYGHLDKQPPMQGWREGLGPFKAVREGERLYGRGGADDGYSVYCALSAMAALRSAGGQNARVFGLIECSEESGSPDLPAYLDLLGDRVGEVGLIICLDSGCADYEHLWVTTSLRGMVGGTLEVEVLTEGVHSGKAGNVVPSSFRLIRTLFDRVEDSTTGEVLLDECWVEIPEQRIEQARHASSIVGDEFVHQFPWAGATRAQDPLERVGVEGISGMILSNSWAPALHVVGISGAPEAGTAGNVLRTQTSVQLSLRLPPGADPDAAADALKARLEADPPLGASVRVELRERARGFDAPLFCDWMIEALNQAGDKAFGRPPAFIGEGGTIPFAQMLLEQFPQSQFAVMGVLGPHSNAHGPNEFLHLGMGEKLAKTILMLVDAHAGVEA